MRLAVAVVTVVALASPTAMAGGTSYRVRITAFETSDAAQAVFVADGGSEELMPGCRVVRVASRYELRSWPWSSEKVFTRQAHRDGLRRLKEAFDSGAETRFGIMGSGLAGEASGKPCAFRSRALALIQEEAGISVVYSLYKHP